MPIEANSGVKIRNVFLSSQFKAQSREQDLA